MQTGQSIELTPTLLVASCFLAALLADQWGAEARRRQTSYSWLDATNRKVCGRRIARPPPPQAQAPSEQLSQDRRENDNDCGNIDNDSDDGVPARNCSDYDSSYDGLEPEDEREGESASARIAAGRPVWPGEFPFYVELQFRIPEGGYATSHCGGVLLHKNLVLTAAHCVMDYKGRLMEELMLVAGQTHLIKSPWRQNAPAQAVEVHPGYDPSQFGPANELAGMSPQMRNDIALVRTQFDFYYNTYTQPICLPDDLMERVATNCEATGFGLISNRTLPENMQAMPMRDCPAPVAFKSLDELCLISSRPLEFPGRPCPGDSGSPLICPDLVQNGHEAQFFVRGTLSHGPKHGCEPGLIEPVVYAGTHFHLFDILKMAAKLQGISQPRSRKHAPGARHAKH